MVGKKLLVGVVMISSNRTFISRSYSLETNKTILATGIHIEIYWPLTSTFTNGSTRNSIGSDLQKKCSVICSSKHVTISDFEGLLSLSLCRLFVDRKPDFSCKKSRNQPFNTTDFVCRISNRCH